MSGTERSNRVCPESNGGVRMHADQLPIVVIIQARMRSSRFPGKVLGPIGNSTVLGCLIDRVGSVVSRKNIMVATTESKSDDILVSAILSISTEIKVYRGSVEDVFERVRKAAEIFCHNVMSDDCIIVDITADCPLVDPEHILFLLSAVKKCGFDYASNVIERTWPDGLDVQVYKLSSMCRLEKECSINREHTGWNFIQNQKGFSTFNHYAPIKYNRPYWELTVDYEEDLKLISLLFDIGNRMVTTNSQSHPIPANHVFPTEKILDFLLTHPWLLDVNKGLKRHKKSNSKAEEVTP